MKPSMTFLPCLWLLACNAGAGPAFDTAETSEDPDAGADDEDASSSSGSGDTGGPSADETGSTGDSGTEPGASSTGEPPAVCGDGVVSGDETCDDANDNGSYGHCKADCSGLGPRCGDGEVQAEEPCDDGNDVNSDGCNVGCEPSGSLAWDVSFAGQDESASNLVHDVSVDPEGRGIAVGQINDGARSLAFVRRVERSGELEDWRTYEETSDTDRIFLAAAHDDEGRLWAVGRGGDGDQGSFRYMRRMYVAPTSAGSHGEGSYDRVDAGSGAVLGAGDEIIRYGSDLDEQWSVTLDENVALVDVGLTIQGTSVLLVRNTITDAHFFHRYEADGDFDTSHNIDDDELASGSIEVLANGDILVAGRRGGSTPVAVVTRYSPGADVRWSVSSDDQPSATWFYDVAADAERNVLACGGIRGETPGDWDPYCKKIGPTGETLWEFTPDFETPTTIDAVALTDDGFGYIGGWTEPAEGPQYAYVAGLTP